MALPDRRHLVADRDRRHPDLAAARRHRRQARLGDAAVLRRASRSSSTATASCWTAPTEGNLCIATAGPARCARSTATMRASSRPISRPSRACTSPATAAAATQDGYYWITGRVDDVINVSGHRMGTAEIESALVAHPKVAEAAVVGYPHDIKGQGIYCLRHAEGRRSSRPRSCARSWSPGCGKEIGPIATPDLIQWAPGLPKTRSGKIMRRILRKIAANEHGRAGRHLHAGRPGRGRRAGREPDEPLIP